MANSTSYASLNDQETVLLSQLANSPIIRTTKPLSVGDNTITPPQSPLPTATWALLVIPSGGNPVLKLKGAAGDTGYTLGVPSSGQNLVLLPLGTATGPDGNVGSFIVNANEIAALLIYWI